VPTRKSLAQRNLNKQRENEYLKKRKLTNKDIEKAIEGLSNNDQFLHDKLLQIDNLLGLYFEWRKTVFKEDTDGFNEFVMAKAKEFEQKQRSENKEGA
jgi:hypothetical protein|tara:strand:- start:222 stop:515 length:294 start_codon:yes stop_codon:yes gene_type:complete